MPLRKIRIKNYTSHKDSVIEFDPYITSIVGLSEQGKTNIFHALRTVCFAENWPVSDIRDYQDEAEIQLWMDDGRSVRDRRTAKSREISFLNARGLVEGDTLRGNAGARERVEAWTGIKRVLIDPDGPAEDINFIQVDESIPVTGQPETVQRRVLNVVGGSSLERARVKLVALVKRLTADRDSASSLLRDLLEEKEKIEKLLAECEPLEQELSEIEGQIESLNKLSTAYEKYLKTLEDHQRINTCGMLKKFRTLLKEYEDLSQEWAELEEEHDKLVRLLQRLEELDSLVQKGSKSLEEASSKLKVLQEELAKFKVCPKCNRPL